MKSIHNCHRKTHLFRYLLTNLLRVNSGRAGLNHHDYTCTWECFSIQWQNTSTLTHRSCWPAPRGFAQSRGTPGTGSGSRGRTESWSCCTRRSSRRPGTLDDTQSGQTSVWCIKMGHSDFCQLLLNGQVHIFQLPIIDIDSILTANFMIYSSLLYSIILLLQVPIFSKGSIVPSRPCFIF